MEIMIDKFENISLSQLYGKLSSKYAELQKLKNEEKIAASQKKDYIEMSSADKNYDPQDFARVLEKFRNKDSEIRTHEQAHATIGPTTSPISYQYQKGPDGKLYAVGGSVRLETSLPDDPKAAAFKLDLLKKAATAPVSLSGADTAIASQTNLNKILLDLEGKNDAS